MKAIITCGPSYEPIDQARRVTNFSTGKLGIFLANNLTDRGWEIVCLKGEGSTCPDTLRARGKESFSTNQDLSGRLQALAGSGKFDAVFHCAALCDFRVARVLDENGVEMTSPKFSTRSGTVSLVLAPAPKVLPLLRGWFPSAFIAGWKYELAGSRDDAFEKAWNQVREAGVDACVLNGAAYGSGFAVCRATGKVEECAGARALAESLARLAEARAAAA
jgi:phosphopantothenoylcysteine decarboxylase/phosphopantothenate--cysteine ligase